MKLKSCYTNLKMENNNQLDCEKPPYWERVKQSYRENGMMYRFYKFLDKLNKRKKKNADKSKEVLEDFKQ